MYLLTTLPSPSALVTLCNLTIQLCPMSSHLYALLCHCFFLLSFYMDILFSKAELQCFALKRFPLSLTWRYECSSFWNLVVRITFQALWQLSVYTPSCVRIANLLSACNVPCSVLLSSCGASLPPFYNWGDIGSEASLSFPRTTTLGTSMIVQLKAHTLSNILASFPPLFAQC